MTPQELRNGKTRGALLIIFCGGNNSSRFTEAKLRNLLRLADEQMHAMGTFEPVGSRGRTPKNLEDRGCSASWLNRLEGAISLWRSSVVFRTPRRKSASSCEYRLL